MAETIENRQAVIHGLILESIPDTKVRHSKEISCSFQLVEL